ncbi:very long chain fatty acid elongase 7 isoform X1 [Rhipicephalus microplus]|uniref:Elongation of very long chain fatty acids protein n=2 Tax=Rhipicephalus microplus TaxID=6941 RepID=A0A6M2D612_RHIMP
MEAIKSTPGHRFGRTSMPFSLQPKVWLDKLHAISDPRTRDYPVVLNPFFVTLMLVAYLYFVKVAGPRWMKNREPFQITNIIRVYNITLVIVNIVAIFVILIPTYLPGGTYSLLCQGLTGKSPEHHLKFYKYGWILVAWRYADLLDTVFFVLRKKFNQVTQLHVIHHTIVVINVWFYTRFAPEGQPALGLALNIFVHAIMYTYYFLASFGARMQKYLWWKKYLTTLQIVQFLIIIVHMSIPLFIDCGFPRHVVHIANAQTFLILCLFINFYLRSYTHYSNKSSAASASANSAVTGAQSKEDKKD